MKEQEYSKLFIYTLLNILCIFLSALFLTSTFNIKEKSKKIECNDFNDFFKQFEGQIKANIFEEYFNQYKTIFYLFAISAISFFVFIACTIYIIVNEIDSGEHTPNNKVKKNVDIIKNNRDDNPNEDKSLNKVVSITFLICQSSYFIEIIFLSVFYFKSKNMESEECNNLKQLTAIYRKLLIVGYVFCGIYIIIYYKWCSQYLEQFCEKNNKIKEINSSKKNNKQNKNHID